jgi:vitamin B12 transporter
MRKDLIIFLGLVLYSGRVEAQRDSILLEGVEVSGVMPRRNTTSTVPVQTVDRQQMMRQGLFGIEDVLRHFAGVTVRDYGGAGGMKTVSVRGVGAKHTAVEYDGVMQTNMQNGEMDLSRFGLANMEDVVLTIGDGSNIFTSARSAASASLLQMESSMLHMDKSGHRFRVGMTMGAWGMAEPWLMAQKKLGEKVTVGVQGDYLHARNDYPFTLYNIDLVTRVRRQNSRMNRGRVETMVCWQISPASFLQGKLYYDDNNRQLPGIVHLYTQDNDERLHEQNAFGQANFQTRLSDRLNMKAVGKMAWSSSLYSVGILSGGVKHENYWQREYYVSTAWLYQVAPWLDVDYSIDGSLNNLNSTLLTPTSSPDGRIAGHPHRYSLLQSLSVKASRPRFTAVARLLRSDYFEGVEEGTSADDAHRFSPSASVSYRLLADKNLFVRASWKSIFRVPSFNELYFYHLGSIDLKPEKTQLVDLGLTGAVETGMTTARFSVDGYLSWVSDKIISVPYNMFVWRTFNVSKVGAYGIDATISMTRQLSLGHRLELSGNYSWQRVEDKTHRSSPYYGYQVAYTPEHAFASSFSWINPWVCLSVSFDGMSSRWATSEHVSGTGLHGMAELGLSAFRRFDARWGAVTVRGGWQNILDRQYEIVANYPMPGRSWKIGVTIEL